MFSIYDFAKDYYSRPPTSPVKVTQKQPTPPSKYLPAYLQWIADVEEQAKLAVHLPQQLLQANRIRVAPEASASSGSHISIAVLSVSCGGLVVSYEVIVGRLVLEVVLLNLNKDPESPSQHVIDGGAYGDIIIGRTSEGEFVGKRVPFARNFQLERQRLECDWVLQTNLTNLREVIEEFAIAKICGLADIGPKILTPFSFDLLCYAKEVEFFMERCWPWQAFPLNPSSAATQLKRRLRMMHLLKFVHRDIKPSNIVWSPAANGLVFCDFGVSHPIAEEPGQTTITQFAGTVNFTCGELAVIAEKDDIVNVDLYYNDMYALNITLQLMTMYQPSPKKQLNLACDPLAEVFAAVYRSWRGEPLDPKQLQIKKFNSGYFKEDKPDPKNPPLNPGTLREWNTRMDALIRMNSCREASRFDGFAEWNRHPLELENWSIFLWTRQLDRLQRPMVKRRRKNVKRFLVSIREPEKFKQQHLLRSLKFIEKECDAEDLVFYRLLLELAYEKPTPQLLDRAEAGSKKWKVEWLSVAEALCKYLELNKLRLSILQKLVAKGNNNLLSWMYSQRELLLLEEHLTGGGKERQFTDKQIQIILKKQPGQYIQFDYNFALVFTQDKSWRRMLPVLERLVMTASHIHFSRLIEQLGICYLSNRRCAEARVCFELVFAETSIPVAMLKPCKEHWRPKLLDDIFEDIQRGRVKQACIKLSVFDPDTQLIEDVRGEFHLTAALTRSLNAASFKRAWDFLQEAKQFKSRALKATHLWRKYWEGAFEVFMKELDYEEVSAFSVDLIKKEMEQFSSQKNGGMFFQQQLQSAYLEVEGMVALATGRLQTAYNSLTAVQARIADCEEISEHSRFATKKRLVRCSVALLRSNTVTQELAQSIQSNLKQLSQRQVFPPMTTAEPYYEQFYLHQLIALDVAIHLRNKSRVVSISAAIANYLRGTQSRLDILELVLKVMDACHLNWPLLLKFLDRMSVVGLYRLVKYDLGAYLYCCQRWLECVPVLEEILKCNINNKMRGQCYRMLTVAHANTGNETSSRAYLHKEKETLQALTKQRPFELTLFNELAVCLEKCGEPDRARLKLLEAMARAMRGGWLEPLTAMNCMLRNKAWTPAKSARILERCRSTHPQVLLHLCKCYLESGRVGRFYKHATAINKNNQRFMLLLRKHLVKGNNREPLLLIFNEHLRQPASSNDTHKMIHLRTAAKRLRRHQLCLKKAQLR